LLLCSILLATRGALKCRDMIVWLALFTGIRVLPLAFVTVVATLLVVIVLIAARGVAVILLLLVVGPDRHHITEFSNGLGSLLPKVSEEVPVGEALLEAVDDVLIGDVGDGGALLKEAASIGMQGLALSLFTLG